MATPDPRMFAVVRVLFWSQYVEDALQDEAPQAGARVKCKSQVLMDGPVAKPHTKMHVAVRDLLWV